MSKPVYTKWIKRSDNTFIPTDNNETVDQIDPGIYKIRYSDGIGYYLFKKEQTNDELIEFPSGVHHQVLNEIRKFTTLQDNFKKYNFTYKRGVLLHGKPGSGKTCTIGLVIQYYIETINGIVINISDTDDLARFSAFMPEIFRMIEKDRPILVVIEDMDGLTHYTDHETRLLNLLDGFDQFENVVYIATTNYIEKLKERIINRPSRFDKRIYIPFLNAMDRKFYFTTKLHEEDLQHINLVQWVDDTDGMSIAHLAELIKLVFVFGNTYDESIAILKELDDIKNLSSYKYEKEDSGIGFSSKKKSSNSTGESWFDNSSTE